MHKIPVSGLVLLLGVDRFLNEARAVTNLIGNGVATIVVARWEGALDMNKARAMLNRTDTSIDALESSGDEAPTDRTPSKDAMVRLTFIDRPVNAPTGSSGFVQDRRIEWRHPAQRETKVARDRRERGIAPANQTDGSRDRRINQRPDRDARVRVARRRATRNDRDAESRFDESQ